MRDQRVLTTAATKQLRSNKAETQHKQMPVQPTFQPMGVPGYMLRLQRQYGNRFVQRVMHQPLQTVRETGKLVIQRRELSYYVVGDRGIDAGGGVFLRQLSSIRDRLIQTHEQHPWTLVISIHGSADRICDVARPTRPRQQCYGASRIQQIFSGSQFIRWRDRYGPTRVVLNACQVSVSFERSLINAVIKAESRQIAQGLGTGCRPDTETVSVETELAGTVRPITSRTQYRQLSGPNQEFLRNQLAQLNQRWGYFGAPPVNTKPDTLLHYYFDEVPRGAWVIVRVSVNRQVQDIPFYNRAQHSDFLKLCNQGIAPLRHHELRVPPLRPSQ